MKSLFNSDRTQGAMAYAVVILLAFAALYFGYGVHNPVDGLSRPVGPAAPANLEVTKAHTAG
jgi:hypothetical protein